MQQSLKLKNTKKLTRSQESLENKSVLYIYYLNFAQKVRK